MSKLPFFSRVVSAFPLALLLVGSLSVVSLASTDIDVLTVTNVFFVKYDDFEDFRTNQLDLVYEVNYATYTFDRYMTQVSNDLTWVRRYIDGIYINIDEGNYSTAMNELQYLNNYMDNYESRLANMETNNRNIRTMTQMMSSALSAPLPTYQIVVQSSSGYECPDYTDILNDLYDRVAEMREDTLWSTDILWNFFHSADVAVSGIVPSLHDEGTGFGYKVGNLVSNVLAFSWSLEDFSNFHSLDHYSQLSYGSPFARDFWNYLLVPYAELLRDSSNPWVDENYMIGSFRDFYMNRQVVVSNAPGSSLSVQVSPDHPFSVVVTNTPYNPVWIDFTGTVDLAEGATLNITNSPDFPLFIDASDITNAIYSLTNVIFTVRVTNATDIGESVVDAEKTAVEDALENTGGDDDFESDDTSFPSDPNNYRGIASSIDNVYRSYSSMFQNIPNYLPNDIELHPGWTLAGITVDPIIWNTQDSASGLTHIRNLFCFFWFIPYAVVVFVCAAVDLFVGGVMCYLAYGLLLGNSKVALDGIYWCYACLCKLFGWDPPKR